MNQLIQEGKERRIAFMKALYEMSGGSNINLIDSHVIGRKIGISNLSEISKIVSYLQEENLIDGDFAAGRNANAYIALTSYGINEVESYETNVPNKSVGSRAISWVMQNVVGVVVSGLLLLLLSAWLGLKS